ncbi:20664_t:CDS:2, partial [Dentiscutata erythropus]
DKVFREQSNVHTKLFEWFTEENEEKRPRPYVLVKFKKRVYSSAFFGSKVTNNYNTKQNRESSPPPVKQIFSFSDEEQGAIIEPILNLRPPINPDFGNADTLNMLNFIIENIKLFDKSVFHGQHKSAPINLFKNFKNNVRHKMAHGILIDQKGRWSDHALQNVAILACDVVTCLGGNYEELYTIKERLGNKIIEKWTDKPTLEVENKNYENQIQPKRKHDDSNFCEMLKFVNETKEDSKQKIMKMALREDEDLIQIWRVVKTTECRKKQSYEFIDFVNLAFNLDLKYIGTEVEQSKFYSDSPEAKRLCNYSRQRGVCGISSPAIFASTPTYQKDDKQEDAKVYG